MESLLLDWLKEYGYIVLFFWSILEGEIGLVLAGILSHTGDMHYWLAIFIAGIGGFTGDQIYFYLGRFSKGFFRKTLKNQHRKFAIATLLLKKYGWPIIFVQRYLYGFRVILPMAFGATHYSAKQYAFINLLSAWIWAAMIIIPAYWYGAEILGILAFARQHWYYSLPIAGGAFYAIYYYLNKLEQNLLKKRHQRVNKNIGRS
jgi:membrane protein DedA with SNARE-associated domain